MAISTTNNGWSLLRGKTKYCIAILQRGAERSSSLGRVCVPVCVGHVCHHLALVPVDPLVLLVHPLQLGDVAQPHAHLPLPPRLPPQYGPGPQRLQA